MKVVLPEKILSKFTKEELLAKTREVVKNFGGRLVTIGEGNRRKVRIVGRDNFTTDVSYPTDRAVNDNEVVDLVSTVEYRLGTIARQALVGEGL